MGRISEFFDYINTKYNIKEREELYSDLTINEKIKKARKEYQKQKREKKLKMHITLAMIQTPGMIRD